MNNKMLVVAISAALAAMAGALYAAPPSVIVYEDESTTHEPDGSVKVHPAQSQVNVCSENSIAYVYNPLTRTMFVPRPCNDLFADGFE